MPKHPEIICQENGQMGSRFAAWCTQYACYPELELRARHILT